MTSLIAALLLLLFGACQADVYFDENFDQKTNLDDWFQSSKAVKEADKHGKITLLSGGKYLEDVTNKGLKTSEDARFYKWGHSFSKTATTIGKPLVIQYTVRFEQDIDCGGGYIKFFPASTSKDDFDDQSEYSIMFGPDICGSDKKLHAIINYKNRNVGLDKPIRCKEDVFSHIYTLILNPDKTFVIKIDNEDERSGSIEDEWKLAPPKKIRDINASKPFDWDDREYVDDENDKKPEDWDKPKFILDEKAKKPEDWDDAVDGEWEASKIENPEYKGEWTPKRIKNEAYKGPWVHPMIDNPEYEPAETFAEYEIDWFAVEIWQVKSGTVFDDFLITDDVTLAEERAKEVLKSQKVQKDKKNKDDDAEREERKERMKTESGNDEMNDIEDVHTPETEDVEPDDDEATDSDDSAKVHEEL